MKKILLICLCLAAYNLYAQAGFDNYFTNGTLRFDYIRAGNNLSNQIYFEQLKMEPYWSGNHKNNLDKFEYGHYKYLVFDSESGNLIYSRGYNTLYDEWQATDEAKHLNRSFYETVVFPYPKKTVRLELHERKRDGNFVKQFEITIDPADKFIR
ncbi:MAG: peptidase M64, partial [Ignavibacteria bacterium]|nr:peptidase M64 [Ignavibacteria bacterium]